MREWQRVGFRRMPDYADVMNLVLAAREASRSRLPVISPMQCGSGFLFVCGQAFQASFVLGCDAARQQIRQSRSCLVKYFDFFLFQFAKDFFEVSSLGEQLHRLKRTARHAPP